MPFRTLDDAGDLKGKRVLLRVDLNVPVNDGAVTDATRIERVAPTIKALSDKGAKVALLAHFERPKGKRVPEMSLEPIAAAVAEVVGRPVGFVDDCIGPEAETAVAKLGDGGIVLLENTRFHKGEEENDPEFAKQLASVGDIYVNDAFSAAHRAHASTEGLAHLLPAYAGLAMQEELEALDKALGHPEHPVVAIVGGAKISSKLELLANLIRKVDALVIGGGMANTFLAAKGAGIGKIAERAGPADDGPADHAGSGAGRLRDRAADRRRRRGGLRGERAAQDRPFRRGPGGSMILDAGEKRSPRSTTGSTRRRRWSGTARSAHSRRNRSTGHRRHGEARREAYARGKTPFGGGRRRHGLRAESCRRCW